MAEEARHFPWQHRLDDFSDRHSDQITEQDARLVFRIRAGDSREDVETYLAARNFPATVAVKPGQGSSIDDNVLSERAVEAIFKRARAVFSHNQHPPKLIRGYDIRSLRLRPGDRLATLPGDGRILEEILVEMAHKKHSIYSVHGAYGPAQTEQFSNLFEYLKYQFNHHSNALPFPLVEALFRGERFELRFVYDGIDRDKDARPESLDVAVDDPIIILAYRRDKQFAGYEPYEGTGFKITHSSHVLPVRVTKNPQKLSKNEPMVCHPLSEDCLPESRYEIRVGPKGRLYVADFASYAGRTWNAVGPWDNKTENIPDDNVAYQILKPVRKA